MILFPPHPGSHFIYESSIYSHSYCNWISVLAPTESDCLKASAEFYKSFQRRIFHPDSLECSGKREQLRTLCNPSSERDSEKGSWVLFFALDTIVFSLQVTKKIIALTVHEYIKD